MLELDLSCCTPLPENWLTSRLSSLADAQSELCSGRGAGGAFTGWVHLPERFDRAELDRIKAAAARIRADSEALVVIGVGGSYLGARAVIELLSSPNHVLDDHPRIFFVGNNFSADAISEVMDLLQDRDFSINVISKSGTTIEPAVSFRIFRELLERRCGSEGARRRIYATTDRSKGALKALADRYGWERFTVPGDIGGRYSVLTAVGLLPIAAAGIDPEALLRGAAAEREILLRPGAENPAWQYAAARNALYESGKQIELLACFEPSFRFFSEWWKQLFGESEGKAGKGLFPASADFTADLHSMGQYIQDGSRCLLETVVRFRTSLRSLPALGESPENCDELNFLAGRTLDDLNEQARRAVQLAHTDGGVPNLLLTLSRRDAESVGQLIYFFEFACGLSARLLGVDPFDQPGVEAYKRNMFALLGKPGYEQLRERLLRRMEQTEP